MLEHLPGTHTSLGLLSSVPSQQNQKNSLPPLAPLLGSGKMAFPDKCVTSAKGEQKPYEEGQAPIAEEFLL